MKKNTSILYTTGASNHSKRERAKNDYYSTDPLAITLLHKKGLLDDKDYWECACGSGSLSDELIKLGYNVSKSTDLYYRGYGEGGVDFLTQTEKFEGNIITNPPFKHLIEFILKGLELTSDKLYIFSRIQVLESRKRYDKIFSMHKPAYVCPFVERIACYPNDDRSYRNNAVCYAWFIWDNNNDDKETKIKWLI